MFARRCIKVKLDSCKLQSRPYLCPWQWTSWWWLFPWLCWKNYRVSQYRFPNQIIPKNSQKIWRIILSLFIFQQDLHLFLMAFYSKMSLKIPIKSGYEVEHLHKSVIFHMLEQSWKHPSEPFLLIKSSQLNKMSF